MHRRIICVVIGLVLLAGCGSQSASQVLNTELQSVKAGAATAHMVGDALVHGNVPQAYANKSLQASEEEIKGSVEKLSSLPQVNAASATGDTPLKHLQHVQSLVEQMGETAARGDRNAPLGPARPA